MLYHHKQNAAGMDGDVANIAGMLEKLCDDLEWTAAESPRNIETEIQQAIERTEGIISQAVPAEQRAKWLSELRKVSEPSSKNSRNSLTTSCSKQDCSCENKKAHEVGSKEVTCIHGCGRSFCCASYRKRQSREHAKVCTAFLARLCYAR